MLVEKIMNKTVVTVDMDDTLELVKEIFDNAKFHHLMVIENGKLFGVLSDRDLLKAISPNIDTPAETTRDAASLNKKVHQIMTRKPITLMADADMYDAIKLFNENTISCIPVVNEQNKPVSILSWRDILKAIASKRA